MRVIINGIGVAGPALAYWLQRSGHEVLLVEEAPRLRAGGYIVDFWGMGYDIVERMGVLDDVRAAGYQMREVRVVDRHGRRKGGFDTTVFHRLTHDRFTSVRRSDISALLLRACQGRVETHFGDSIADIRDAGRRVHVSFEHAADREADLVVGADGLHSRVRRMVFGPDSGFEVRLGYHVAAFEVAGYPRRDDLVYISHNLPGRQVSRFSLRGDRTMFLFVFRNEYFSGAEEPKAQLRRMFAGSGWEWRHIEAALEQADELYLDTVSQIRMSGWTRGRVALIGDAAACVSLMAGEGTGLAIIEAYVLAGELRRSGGDLAAAFAQYESLLRPFLLEKQRAAAKFASSFAPKTSAGIAVRNLATTLMRLPAVADWLIGRNLRDNLTLPPYEF